MTKATIALIAANSILLAVSAVALYKKNHH